MQSKLSRTFNQVAKPVHRISRFISATATRTLSLAFSRVSTSIKRRQAKSAPPKKPPRGPAPK
jgi:hypothetical protein